MESLLPWRRNKDAASSAVRPPLEHVICLLSVSLRHLYMRFTHRALGGARVRPVKSVSSSFTVVPVSSCTSSFPRPRRGRFRESANVGWGASSGGANWALSVLLLLAFLSASPHPGDIFFLAFILHGHPHPGPAVRLLRHTHKYIICIELSNPILPTGARLITSSLKFYPFVTSQHPECPPRCRLFTYKVPLKKSDLI